MLLLQLRQRVYADNRLVPNMAVPTKAMPAPPEGHYDENTPGFYDNRAWITHITISVCLAWSMILVGLRIWVRRFIINRMGIDDWFAIISLLFIIGEGTSMVFCGQFGMGRHSWAIPKDRIWLYLRSFYVTIVMYTSALLCLKLTLILQYYRVLAVQYMRKWYIGAIILIALWGVIQLLLSSMWCVPIQGLWDPTVHAKCISTYPQIYISAGGNIITDVIVIMLPMPAILRLQVPKGQKLILLGIFSLGFLTGAISGIRIKYLDATGDFTWINVQGSSWSLAELTCGLTCACLPTLKPALSKISPTFHRHIIRHPSSDEESGRPPSKSPLVKVRGSTNITSTTYTGDMTVMSTTKGHSLDNVRNDSGGLSSMQYHPNTIFPWSYISQNTERPVAEADVLRIQQNIGLTTTAITEISASKLQESEIPHDGTIRITQEVTFTTS